MEKDGASKHSTDGMVAYNANSLAQKQHALGNSTVIADLAERVSELPGPLNITDYGRGPGQSAIETVRPALKVWQAWNPPKDLIVCHADQPGNDWSALMALVFGDTGYLEKSGSPLVISAVGSFYDRLAPDSSVSLATSFFASHWLNSTACFNAPETVWFADLTGEARRIMWQNAERDWVRFLRLRAKELRPGGYLFVSTLGAVPEAGETNDTAASGRNIYRALQAVTASMAKEGLLDRTAADEFVFGLWFMTEVEARGPLERHPELAQVYDIDTLEVVPVDEGGDLFSNYLDDPAEYARRYAGYTKAFAATSLRKQLFAPSVREGKDLTFLETEFFWRFEQIYREKMQAFALEQWHLKVILRRTDYAM